MTTTGTACGKLILLGEHAVVYGKPAIAVPFCGLQTTATVEPADRHRGLRVSLPDSDEVVTPSDLSHPLMRLCEEVARLSGFSFPADMMLDITATSTIPMASGFGSGAALSTAIARALFAHFRVDITAQQLNALIYAAEEHYHGTPSGIDNTVIVYEMPILFIREKPLQLLQIATPLTLLVGYTGIVASTKIAVGDVRKLYETDPEKSEAVFRAIDDCVRRAIQSLQQGDILRLGSAMTENHQHLKSLTVSSPQLDQLVDAALNAGAIGAKLSGGGRGGNMVALVEPDQAQPVSDALLAAGAANVYKTVVHTKDGSE